MSVACATQSHLDQTFFAETIQTQTSTYILSLVISVVTPNETIQPIEIKLIEPRSHQPSVQTLQGFSTAEAIQAAKVFADLYQRLQSEPKAVVAEATIAVSWWIKT